MADEDTELADQIGEDYIKRVTWDLGFDEPTRRPIRREMIEGLLRYKDHAILPGSFLAAVLQNDLKEAIGRADLYNQHSLPAIVSWCYNNLPAGSWGSPEKVQRWLTK